MADLQSTFGPIDIYLFDQLLRGRIARGMRVVDAGCGGGRNLVYLLREGFDVYGADQDAGAVEAVRKMAGDGAAERFHVEPIEAMTFPNAFADVVLVSAVLHFARDHEHFEAMLRGAWRTLKPGGLWFSRLASTIGLETRVKALGAGRYRLPDGSDRYLMDEAGLMRWTAELGGKLLDPLKTTVVQDQRSMTTWVMLKG